MFVCVCVCVCVSLSLILARTNDKVNDTNLSRRKHRNGLNSDGVRFMIDGDRINPTDTPKMLELEDGDMIQAAVEQVGGF